MKKGEKRGLSTVVISLIIILISLVAVGIIWVVVRNVIQTGTKEVTLGQFSLSAKIKNVFIDNSSNNVSFIVKRNAGQGEFSKLNFVFYDGKSSEIVTQPVSLNELEEKWFMFHLSTLNVSDLISISIFPYVKQDEKEILGNILDKYTVRGQTSTIILPVCIPATCASLGYECGTNWANGTNCAGALNCEPPNCTVSHGAGYTCNANGRCIFGTCTPLVNNYCSVQGYECGYWGNLSCSGNLSCGTCGSQATCPSGTCVCNSGWGDCNNDNTCECNLASNSCSGGNCVATPSGTIYYVDFQNGNDSNNGLTPATAWKTIPGTMLVNPPFPNPGQTDQYAVTSWYGGNVSLTNKLSGGITFRLKPGTTYGSANGGLIYLDSGFYNVASITVNNPITFEAYQSWPGASGPVTFDGNGMGILSAVGSGYGLILMRTGGGFVFDGKVPGGIVIKNAAWNGISSYGSSELEGLIIKYVKFYNNGVSIPVNDASGASEAQLKIVYSRNGRIENCEFDGNKRVINGILFGESNSAVTNYTIINTIAYNHFNSSSDDDAGIGFKAQNSQATWINCTAYNNNKGWDLGEESGNGRNIIYKIINNFAYNNSFGINLNAAGSASYTGTVTWYLINNIIRDNKEMGSNIYAGPFRLYMVHNVYDNNGWAGSYSPPESNNIGITPDQVTNDNAHIEAYLYNNIFYKPGGGANFLVSSILTVVDSDLNLYFDYNSWVQRGTEMFCQWSYFYGALPGVSYSYGANGPGHASGNWYTLEDEPGNGIGHLNADSNSKGTGATDATLPPFVDVANHNYKFSSSYLGTSLSAKPWYIPEMGVDRAGNARTTWNIGAYEYP